MKGIPINPNQLPKTRTDLGPYQRAEGLRGMDVDLSRSISAAGNTATIDPKGFIVSEQAVGNIGRAIAESGGILTGILQKQNEAIMIRQEQDARLTMESEAAEISVALEQEPDERKWTEIVTKRTAAAKDRFVKEQQLSPAARDSITNQFNHWEQGTKIKTTHASARQSFKRAGDKILGSVISDVDAGNFERAERTAEGYVAAGYETEAWLATLRGTMTKRAESNNLKAKAAAYDAGLNGAVQTAADAGEDEALKSLDSGMYGTHDAADKERIRNSIQAVARDRGASALNELTEGIVTGGLKSPAAIDALDTPHLSPVLKERAKEYLRGFDADKARMEREQNGVRNAVELRQAVRAYDPKTDPTREKLFSLNKEIRTRVDEVNSGELTEELYQKYGTTPPKVTVRPELERNVSKSLDAMFDAETGAIPWRTKTTDPATGEKITTEDPKARQRAIDSQTAVEMKMNNWFKQNPDDAQSLPKVKAKLQELLPEGTRSAALDSLQSLLAPPPARTEPPDLGAQGARGMAGPGFTPAPGSSRVTSYAYARDESPDSNSSAGIGAFVPEAEQAKIKRGEPSPYKLRAGDFAVSRDVEKEMRKAGIQPGDEVTVQLDDGSTETGRWMDRTAEDWPIGSGKAVTGRFDFYQGGQSTKHPKEAAKVTGFRRAVITNE